MNIQTSPALPQVEIFHAVSSVVKIGFRTIQHPKVSLCLGEVADPNGSELVGLIGETAVRGITHSTENLKGVVFFDASGKQVAFAWMECAESRSTLNLNNGEDVISVQVVGDIPADLLAALDATAEVAAENARRLARPAMSESPYW